MAVFCSQNWNRYNTFLFDIEKEEFCPFQNTIVYTIIHLETQALREFCKQRKKIMVCNPKFQKCISVFTLRKGVLRLF